MMARYDNDIIYCNKKRNRFCRVCLWWVDWVGKNYVFHAHVYEKIDSVAKLIANFVCEKIQRNKKGNKK